jgi:predicted porin
MSKSIKGFSSVVLSALFLLVGAGAQAEEQYRAEVSGFYSWSDADQNFRTILYGVSGELFFEPVNTDEHAYAEAAFLERAGSVFVTAAKVDEKLDSLEGDGPLFAVRVNYAKKGFPLAIQAEYTRTKVDYKDPFSGDTTDNEYALKVGNYFMDNLLAGVEYSYRKSETEIAGFLPSEIKTTDYALFAKYVQDLGHHHEVSLEASVGQSKEKDEIETLTNTFVSLLADYYFSRSLRAGAGIENSSGENDAEEGITYSANVRYYITPRFSIQAVYDRFLNSHDGLESDRTFNVIAAARF